MLFFLLCVTFTKKSESSRMKLQRSENAFMKNYLPNYERCQNEYFR